MRILAALTVLVALQLNAQSFSFNFDSIAEKAKKKTELMLDHPPQFTSVDSLSVNHYEFAKPGQYSDHELDPLRKQVSSTAGWSRIINVQEDGQHTEIYMLTKNGKPSGFLLIAAQPDQLTVLHATGSIELSELGELVKSKLEFKGTQE